MGSAAPEVDGPGAETVGPRMGSAVSEVDGPGADVVRARVRSAAAMRSGVVLVLDGGPELVRGWEDDFVFFLTTAWPLVSSASVKV